ncbi:DUF2062 domain-containing protein [Caldimonas sp.]|uniref:DUF2062 domain-containing protein n=1 Tax=Caldimonas sp. TaxID=2838790 RepID=UPI00307F182D
MKRWLPTREQLLASKWLRPVAHRLQDDHLWHLDRGSVARAVSIGLFFGFMLPVAQFLFAVVTAVFFRANVAVAAASTLVTNPFTFPPVYWLAYQIGSWVLGHRSGEIVAQALESQIETLAQQQSWWQGLWQSIQSTGAPLVVGLAILAVVSSTLGYVLVWVLWRPHEPPQERG